LVTLWLFKVDDPTSDNPSLTACLSEEEQARTTSRSTHICVVLDAGPRDEGGVQALPGLETTIHAALVLAMNAQP
jgi:hypothetical protein